MNTINELVKKVQAEEKGSIVYEQAFADLFTVVMVETIEPKVECFKYQLNGDISEGIALGTELLMELVKKWDGTGSFHNYYKASLHNRLINLVHMIGRNVRKHNTSYDYSLSDTASLNQEGSSPILEVLDDDALTTSFDITDEGTALDELLESFSRKHPKQAELLEIMLTFSNDAVQSDKTEAYCRYYGAEEYTQAIQKRVSRVRQTFKKFLTDNSYDMAVA